MADPTMNNAQQVLLARAKTVTKAQIAIVDELLETAGVTVTHEHRLSMLQTLATNYLAERTKA